MPPSELQQFKWPILQKHSWALWFATNISLCWRYFRLDELSTETHGDQRRNYIKSPTTTTLSRHIYNHAHTTRNRILNTPPPLRINTVTSSSHLFKCAFHGFVYAKDGSRLNGRVERGWRDVCLRVAANVDLRAHLVVAYD